jgi:hypothetical protein|nr:MAG TPA: Protein of unknown function (DUF1642) [Caudoviricetes sp.]
MEHVGNLFKDSENLDVIVKGTVTGKSMNSQDEVLYQIETPCGDCFEADERCVYHDVTKPVEVPQYVADWYEENKNNLDYNLWNFIMDWDEQEPSEFKQWINGSKEAFKTIVNMHQFGYKVDREKLYIVRIKGFNGKHSILKYDEFSETWYFGDTENNVCIREYHTRKQIEEAGLSGVFNNPMFEVKEVE